VAESFVFTEEPGSERDKRAVRREDPNEDGIGEIAGGGVTVDFVDIPVSRGTRGRRRRARDRDRERRGSGMTIDWGILLIEVGKGVEGGSGGNWG
jgi:hypothetical protein